MELTLLIIALLVAVAAVILCLVSSARTNERIDALENKVKALNAALDRSIKWDANKRAYYCDGNFVARGNIVSGGIE